MAQVQPTTAGLSLSPTPRAKLAVTVAQQLLAEIRRNRLQPGTRLPSERELMAMLGVGRSTIREAVNGLAMLGAVEIRHGQGAFVANAAAGLEAPDAIAVALARGVTRDLFEARLIIEVETARLAAARRTETDLREIEQALVDHQRAIDADALAVEPSVRFHTAIAQAAHSEVLAGCVASFGSVLTEHGPLLEAEPGYREWEIEQHRRVFEPIRDGDAAEAAVRMRAHLDAVIPFHERIAPT